MGRVALMEKDFKMEEDFWKAWLDKMVSES